MHLSMGQHGAYFLLLRWIYTTGTPVPHKQRFSIAQAKLDSDRSDVEAMLAQFFVKKGDGWHSLKAEKIMEEAEEKHQKRVEAGRIGGKQRSSNAEAMPEHRLTTHNHNHNHKEESKKNGFSTDLVVGKNGLGNGHVTVKDPRERIARFQKKLAEAIPNNGWLTVIAAADPAAAGHLDALEICKLTAKRLGKGWPQNWFPA
jgi:uncharacterized protein YdaU (DUF1376 family)